ncbi:hypothetical protein GCM10025881_28000 [Pseudolysinimonas kribbensis]|uniref:Uncharacterized protein n=1 Tax=Pseudolysinimonas kribbensis TaxID=433641 RepID=A0ABQ6KBM1_9MICO|nr:hypothetical protein [Pseudolysinimonas kribbensis]GMA95976.1 hypothetical protein GCM10025881_28000 [Pseudolysinimonas kribbensis]
MTVGRPTGQDEQVHAAERRDQVVVGARIGRVRQMEVRLGDAGTRDGRDRRQDLIAAEALAGVRERGIHSRERAAGGADDVVVHHHDVQESEVEIATARQQPGEGAVGRAGVRPLGAPRAYGRPAALASASPATISSATALPIASSVAKIWGCCTTLLKLV